MSATLLRLVPRPAPSAAPPFPLHLRVEIALRVRVWRVRRALARLDGEAIGWTLLLAGALLALTAPVWVAWGIR